jgi:hypothetical protein
MFALILFLMVFPIFDPGVFSKTTGPESVPIYAAMDPVNLILLGMGLLFAGTRA